MNTQDQRKDAVKLAVQLGATHTLEIIKQENSSIQEILQSAEGEIGLDKLIPVILENYPNWALGALRYLPNVGKYEAQLREKAGISFLQGDESTAGAAARPGAGLQSIDTFEMYVACGAGYTANFTMWYFTPPFSNKWTKSNVDTGGKVPVCQSQTKLCTFFSNPDAPLQPGDTVMMTVGIAGNKDWQPTNIWFTYDPVAKYTAQIDCHGQVLNPSFSFSIKGD